MSDDVMAEDNTPVPPASPVLVVLQLSGIELNLLLAVECALKPISDDFFDCLTALEGTRDQLNRVRAEHLDIKEEQKRRANVWS